MGTINNHTLWEQREPGFSGERREHSLSTATPVVRWLDDILRLASAQGASDIHLEPLAHGMRLRFRIDGHLCEQPPPPPELKDSLVSRIKVLGNLDISEKRLPQDGHINIGAHASSPVALRVSTLPTVHGEKVVLRILAQTATSLQLEQLGLEPEQLSWLTAALRQSQGMILATGPTGSGKTVTLYSCLQQLNQPHRNISTVEDPAEIRLDGVTQVNVNEKAGLHFATVMRALLRQDPDVIMVGEIRDAETADIAVKAAQTGHLVLSTLHTNDAPSTLVRLLHMGIPAYQVASSVSLICAQRLVRRLCDACKERSETKPHTWTSLQDETAPAQTLYRAVGCSQCVGGYSGRIGVFEVMPITEALAAAMMGAPSTARIQALARQAGVLSLRQAAWRKAYAGLTCAQEVLSQTPDD